MTNYYKHNIGSSKKTFPTFLKVFSLAISKQKEETFASRQFIDILLFIRNLVNITEPFDAIYIYDIFFLELSVY